MRRLIPRRLRALVPQPLRALLRRLVQGAGEPGPRPRDDANFSIAVPLDYKTSEPAARRTGVILHLFHVAMAAEFVAVLAFIPGHVDLFVSTDTPDKANEIRAVFAGWPRGVVDIRVAENRGRDIPSKFITFRDVHPHYDLILCLHSKLSAYLGSGQDWRRLLVDTLVGSPQIVASIFTLFDADPGLGVVLPQNYDDVRCRISWGGNRDEAGLIARRMGIDLDQAAALDFVAGSMFWARPAALAPLLALNLTVEDFPPEAGQMDATLAHAIERLILYGAEHAGFRWLKVANPALYQDRSTILRIRSARDLARAMSKADFRLLPRAV